MRTASPVAGDRYRAVCQSLAALGPEELAGLAARARRRFDPGLGPAPDAARPQRAFEPRPRVIEPSTWAAWEAGVAARVTLLDLVAADVHGPQQLVTRGLLPAELVWGDAELVRAGIGRPPVGGRWLVHAAVDVGVDENGRPVALADDTATFAGLGRAHENRLTTAELLPGLFTRARVRRLVPFLDQLRARLAALAPAGPGPARVVILSPPRSDPAHDDAAQLARTLGYTLAEGPDLTVRRGGVHLRSLAGLEPVRVVLRLLPDRASDPLELDPGSIGGTVALVAASHRGAVALANPIGAGWLANPALGAFLPAVGRALRGDDAALPGPPAWWCGEDRGRRAALDQLGTVVLHRLDGGATLDSRRSTIDELAGLRARVEAEPRRWVAVRPPTLATAAGQAGPAISRLFALTVDDGVVVAPGGLTHLLGQADETPAEGSARPGSTRPTLDTWVLEVSGARTPRPTRVVVQDQVDFADSLPARAGESLYWLGRHAERAEAVVRLAAVVVATADDLRAAGRPAAGGPALLGGALDRLTGAATDIPGFAAGDGPGVDARRAAARALADRSLPRGLSGAVRGLVTSAGAVRELLSPELFRAVGDAADACDAVAAAPGGPDQDGQVLDAAQRVLGDLAAVAGLAQETMVRGPGWYLLDAGRRLERALALLDVLLHVLGGRPVHHVEAGLLEALLSQSASLIAYRRRYRSDPELAAVLGLLVVDGGNPRSLRFQLDALALDLGELPDGGRAAARGALATTAAGLAERVGRLQPPVLARPGAAGDADHLVDLLAGVRAEVVALATALHLEYIAQVVATALPTATAGAR